MRHRKAGRKLGRNGPHRESMMRNMVTSFLEHERIQTTVTRAKELRKIAEHLITLGKRGLATVESNKELSEEALNQKRLHLFRLILQTVRNKDVARKILNQYAERYSTRPGGYTRILKLGPRKGDCAPMSVIELVEASSSK